jgi:acyl dehydratase
MAGEPVTTLGDIMRKIRYYEDVEVGEELVSQTRTITESDVVSFAALSDDWSELHISEEFARKSAYGRRIAHGLLGLIITEGLKLRAGADEFAGIASLGWTWDFKGPIFLGDTIHVRGRLRDKRTTKKRGRGIFYLTLQVVNQRGEVVQEGEHRLMVETRENTQSAYA